MSSVRLVQRPLAGLFARWRSPAQARGTILFMHGLGESGLCFEALLREPRLAAWRLVAVDLPGYGKSPWPPTPSCSSSTVETLAAWMQAAELMPAVVVGHSMGGVLGADLVRRHPECACGFLNVEGNISFDDCTLSREAAADSLGVFLAGGHGRLLDAVYRRGVADPPLRGYYASLRMADPSQLHRDACALVKRSKRERLASETAAVACPVRYLLGDPRGAGARSRALLDTAEVAWRAIPHAGHWPFLDQHQAFVDALVSFLASAAEAVPPPARTP